MQTLRNNVLKVYETLEQDIDKGIISGGIVTDAYYNAEGKQVIEFTTMSNLPKRLLPNLTIANFIDPAHCTFEQID
jgi:hypothetical protein